MKSLYKRLVAVLGATSICVMLMVGCGGQKPAEEVKTGGAVVDSTGPGNTQYNFTTLSRTGTMSYPTNTKANKIDLSLWIVSGTAPNAGTIDSGTIVNVTSMNPVPGTVGQPAKPALPLSAITDQAVQVTSDDTTAVPKPK